MRRSGLGGRIAALSVGVAVVTALIAGALSIGLIRASATGEARTTLRRLADVAQTVADRGTPAQLRAVRALAALRVRVVTVDGSWFLHTRSAGAAAAISATDIRTVLAGQDVSALHGNALVEGRPTASGGVFVVQRRSDAVAANNRAVRRIVLALLIASGVAALVGLAFAARLARPLRRTAAAARALAAGRRDVNVPVQGPAELAEVGAAINGLAAALRVSEERQRRFLLSVSHDLRTPLTAISGYAESLAEGVVPADETSQVGGVVLAESRRLERLVSDLLDLARLDAHDLRLEPTDVDLEAVADEAATVWADRCAAAGVRFRREGTGQHGGTAQPLPVRTDAGRIRQALDGLLENALRVTPSGAPIVLATRMADGSAVVEVRDGGPGLTADDITVAFQQGELYRRYRGARQVGTGLGLAIVHSLVSRLGGTVEAGHAEEGGAAFTIRLPLRR